MEQNLVGTWLISQSLGRQHDPIIKLCSKYIEGFKQLGNMEKVVIRSMSAGRPVEEYLLNDKQVLFLISLIRVSSDEMMFLKTKLITASGFIAIIKALNDFDFDAANQRYVYAAQDKDGNIKIGISNDPEKRIEQLSIGSAQKLKLIFTKASNGEGYSDEIELQRKCLPYHIRSEWFTKKAREIIK